MDQLLASDLEPPPEPPLSATALRESVGRPGY